VSTPADTATVVRVEKGHVEPEELAALTAVLLARAAAAGRDTQTAAYDRPRTAGWRRLERTPGFRSAHSWQG